MINNCLVFLLVFFVPQATFSHTFQWPLRTVFPTVNPTDDVFVPFPHYPNLPPGADCPPGFDGFSLELLHKYLSLLTQNALVLDS